MKDIVLLSLFGGIDGFALGFLQAGYTIQKHYYSEIDKHASANCKYNFKKSIHLGSVTNVSGRTIERPNVITFGSPCQDFSIAGKGAGMGGNRSSLITEAIRIVSECRPDVFIWENVKGAFSSNDSEDFWGIIQAFANIGGYRLEWQLLNTSWFLPQNRERIYLVGHLAGSSEPGVFPIRDNNKICHKTGKAEEEAYNIASTLMTEAYNKNTGNFIKINYLDWKQSQDNMVHLSDGLSPSLGSSNGSMMPKIKEPVKIISHYGHKDKDAKISDISPTLKAESHGHEPMTNDKHGIRRLTEIECERLQGFPDDWTRYGDYNGVIKEIPKTQRYKMCGNAVTVNVVKEIANRIKIL